jgi:hypothetical protein
LRGCDVGGGDGDGRGIVFVDRCWRGRGNGEGGGLGGEEVVGVLNWRVGFLVEVGCSIFFPMHSAKDT